MNTLSDVGSIYRTLQWICKFVIRKFNFLFLFFSQFSIKFSKIWNMKPKLLHVNTEKSFFFLVIVVKSWNLFCLVHFSFYFSNLIKLKQTAKKRKNLEIALNCVQRKKKLFFNYFNAVCCFCWIIYISCL